MSFAWVAAGVLREEGGELGLVEAEEVDDRPELPHRRVELGDQRPRVPEHPLGRREALHRRVDQRVQLAEQRLEVGRQSAEVLQRRAQLPGRGPELGDQRVGVDGELRQPLERLLGLALERGQRDERLLELLVAQRGGLEDTVGVLDQRAQLAVALGQRLEHDARVRDQARDGALLAVEDVDQLGGVLGERPEVAERVVEVAPVAADAARLLLHPGLERRSRLGVEGAVDLVELDRVGDLRLRQRAAFGQRLGVARCPA